MSTKTPHRVPNGTRCFVYTGRGFTVTNKPENASQLGTHFLYGANGGQDFLGKGNQQTAEQAQEALAALAGIVALDAHTHLHNAPAQDDDAHGLNGGENEVGEVIHNSQRIGCGCPIMCGYYGTRRPIRDRCRSSKSWWP